jgi:ferric-dicitrate binding protein FerR (iron transport regulator)
MSEIDENHAADDEDLARLLGAAGPRENPPEATRARWEAGFRTELAPVIERRRRRPLYAVAASVAVVALSLLLVNTDSGAPTDMSVRAVSGESRVIAAGQASPTALPGQILRNGDGVQTGTASALALRWGSYDVRLNEDSRIRLYDDRIELQAGELYVSSDSRQKGRQHIAIVTPRATVRDIGTQFIVRLQGDGLVSTVRAGSIVVATENEELTASAQPGKPQQVSLNGKLVLDEVATGTDWDWIYALSPAFDTRGRSVHDFLSWSVRESGMTLQFDSESTEIAVRLAILGPADISALDPEQAVDLVMSTTRFLAEPRGEVLFIRRD